MKRDLQIQEFEIPEGKELLEDVYYLKSDEYDLLEEGEGKTKKFKLKGKIGHCDIPTANKRVYPKKVMGENINRLMPSIKDRKVYGMLDHPADGKTHLDSVSHMITGLSILEDGAVDGELEFIPGTKNGDQAIAILKAGGILGVSSRGFGTTVPDTKGNHVVQEGYQLVTYDVVADPAAAGAFPKAVYEEKEMGNMTLKELREKHPEVVKGIMEELKREVEPEAREHAREALREEFEAKLLESAEDIKNEAREEERKRLLEDPEVAGSATAMKRIVDVVAPFVLSEDEDRLVADQKKKLENANRKLAEADEEISRLEDENEELAEIAKEALFKLHMEKSLGDDERRTQIEGMVGDVKQFDSLEELKDRISEIQEALSEEDEAHEEYEEEIRKLRQENVKLESERDKALGLSKQFGVKAYIEKRLADHPRRTELREYLNEANFDTKKEIDEFVVAFDRENPTSDEYDDIRNYLDEDSDDDAEDIINEDKKIFGVSTKELANL